MLALEAVEPLRLVRTFESHSRPLREVKNILGMPVPRLRFLTALLQAL